MGPGVPPGPRPSVAEVPAPERPGARHADEQADDGTARASPPGRAPRVRACQATGTAARTARADASAAMVHDMTTMADGGGRGVGLPPTASRW